MNEEKNISTGLLKGEEYRPRYSDTLKEDSDADLDEINEITIYLDKQDKRYRQELNVLSSSEKPLDTHARLIVTIIAFGEGTRIKDTLKKYINQDLDPSLYEIVLLDNHPESVSRDNTRDEVLNFIKEHPELKIVYAYKMWSNNQPATIGNARKYAQDIALNRVLKRNKADASSTIIISHDADAIFYASNYLSSILNKFDSTLEIDALVTDMSRPDNAMSKPNVYAAVELLRLLEGELIKENVKLGEPADPAIFVGASYGVRAAMLAAAGGCNPNATVHDDRELGWVIANARKWDPKRIVQFNETKMTTDARRFIDALASGLPADLMLLNFNVKPDIRQMNTEEVLNLISDDVIWELLEEDINSTWLSQHSGNKLYAKKFPDAFKKVMKTLGIEYSIIDGNVKLKSVNELIKILSLKYGRKISITHCEPIIYTDKMIQEIKSFFGSLSDGAVKAREISIGR